jgi:hypothetical protein
MWVPALLFLSSAAAADGPAFERDVSLRKFYRGNTHTHSLRSDGDSPIETVIRTYRDAGYHFLVLTDHNRASARGEFAALETETFKTVAGEEISYYSPVPGQKKLPVHVNAICSTRTAGGAVVEPVARALQQAVDAVTAQPGALAQINHPNFEWALRYEDILGVKGASLLEIANQHPHVNNPGNGRRPSVEVLWDKLLTAGQLLYGVADDDVHDLKADSSHNPPRRPFKGWVQVAADELSDTAICQALEEGRFYSSTGVELEAIEVAGGAMTIAARGEGLVTEFIADGGRVAATVKGRAASYLLKGDESYVRARVRDPKTGAQAWVQPVYRRR